MNYELVLGLVDVADYFENQNDSENKEVISEAIVSIGDLQVSKLFISRLGSVAKHLYGRGETSLGNAVDSAVIYLTDNT